MVPMVFTYDEDKEMFDIQRRDRFGGHLETEHVSEWAI